MNTLIGAGGSSCGDFSHEELLEREVKVTLDCGHANLVLEARAVGSNVLEDGLVVVHENMMTKKYGFEYLKNRGGEIRYLFVTPI